MYVYIYIYIYNHGILIVNSKFQKDIPLMEICLEHIEQCDENHSKNFVMWKNFSYLFVKGLLKVSVILKKWNSLRKIWQRGKLLWSQ
jgi:hypothetical protein